MKNKGVGFWEVKKEWVTELFAFNLPFGWRFSFFLFNRDSPFYKQLLPIFKIIN